ncbi:MAG: heme exporter protein CcmB [Candidatus Poribacteria bacterium]|nr:heme exporter protein CcmB [Candidatus Poribacteria bacterium]MDE0503571.1 heme exporter protein CcmB [Candidatus Poribacteria bacterium]
MKTFRQIGWLVRKDVALFFRTKDTLVLIVVFSVLVVLIFGLAFGPVFPQEAEDRGKLAASVLWTAFAFAGIILLNRSFDVERASGALHGVRLTGVDPGNLYLSKVVSNLIILAVLEAMITPVALQFLDALDTLTFQTLAKLIGVLIVGAVGFCAVGVTISGISTSTHGKESLLSVILLPLIFPIIMAGAKCTVSLLTAEGLEGNFWISTLVIYGIVFLSSSYLLFEFVIED